MTTATVVYIVNDEMSAPSTVELNTPGQRIKFMRKAKGWNQETLASKVYVSQPAVSQWESDGVVPARQSQMLLAEALGTTREFLFGEQVA